MNYLFPEITHIDQVRAAIAAHGHDEFIEAERDGLRIFNYLVNKPDTFPSADTEMGAILRECRGITFGLDGTVVARKFHKFFNLNERSETEFRHIDWTQPHVILEKLDGSMITLHYSPVDLFRKDPKTGKTELIQPAGTVYPHTKMGFTDVARMVFPFLEKNLDYAICAMDLSKVGHTPIFEFCSRKNRVVIDHPVDRLVLLAVRDNVTGAYYNHDELAFTANAFDLELVRLYEGKIETMEAFIEEARAEPDIEGYVVRFENGHMLKIKADVYLTLHKAVSQLSQEKDVWQLVVEDKIDDLKAILPEDQRKRLEKFETAFWAKFDVMTADLVKGVAAAQVEIEAEFVGQEMIFEENGLARAKKKDFALHHAPKFGVLMKASFQVYDGKDAREMVKNFVRSNVRTSTKVDAFRGAFDGLTWTEYEMDED